MEYKDIETPRGRIIVNAEGKAELSWSTGFAPKWNEQYSAAQKYIDSEVLRLSEPMIPLLTGMLIASGILGTDVGSGTVHWIAPYAKAQYYSRRKPGSYSGPQRGPYWFERFKTLHGAKVISGARKIAGGGQ